MEDKVIYREESYKIIGACIAVHKELGMGFLEVIYKDALEIEFQRLGIPYVREQLFEVFYKGIKLNRTFKADFVVYDKIVLEAKSASCIVEDHENQTLNYCACAKMKLGIVANFGAISFQQKRIIL